MATRTVLCPECALELPYGRLSCTACGGLLAAVSGPSRRSVPTVRPDINTDPVAGEAGALADAVAAEPSRPPDEVEEESWLPGDALEADLPDSDPRAAIVWAEPGGDLPGGELPGDDLTAAGNTAIQAPDRDEDLEASGADEALEPTDRNAAAEPSRRDAAPDLDPGAFAPVPQPGDWFSDGRAVQGPASLGRATLATEAALPVSWPPAGSYLPPSAAFEEPRAEGLLEPPATSPSRPSRAGSASLFADLPFDAPKDIAGWLVTAGGSLAALGFLLPWARAVIGAGGTGGYLDTWGLANPAHLPVFLVVLGVFLLSILPNRLPAWAVGGVVGLVLGGLLLGLAWPYLFGRLQPSAGVYVETIGAITLIVGAVLSLGRSHRTGSASA